jgi:hypothetical protein
LSAAVVVWGAPVCVQPAKDLGKSALPSAAMAEIDRQTHARSGSAKRFIEQSGKRRDPSSVFRLLRREQSFQKERFEWDVPQSLAVRWVRSIRRPCPMARSRPAKRDDSVQPRTKSWVGVDTNLCVPVGTASLGIAHARSSIAVLSRGKV